MAGCKKCGGASKPFSDNPKGQKARRAKKQSQPIAYNAFAHGGATR